MNKTLRDHLSPHRCHQKTNKHTSPLNLQSSVFIKHTHTSPHDQHMNQRTSSSSSSSFPSSSSSSSSYLDDDASSHSTTQCADDPPRCSIDIYRVAEIKQEDEEDKEEGITTRGPFDSRFPAEILKEEEDISESDWKQMIDKVNEFWGPTVRAERDYESKLNSLLHISIFSVPYIVYLGQKVNERIERSARYTRLFLEMMNELLGKKAGIVFTFVHDTEHNVRFIEVEKKNRCPRGGGKKCTKCYEDEGARGYLEIVGDSEQEQGQARMVFKYGHNKTA